MAISSKILAGVRRDGQKGLFAKAAIAAKEILIHYDGPLIDVSKRA